jgi:hypothetical protein
MRARLRTNVDREDVGGQFGCASGSSSFARATQLHDTIHCINRNDTSDRFTLKQFPIPYRRRDTASLEEHLEIAYIAPRLQLYHLPPRTTQDKFPRHPIPTDSEGAKKDIPSTSS